MSNAASPRPALPIKLKAIIPLNFALTTDENGESIVVYLLCASVWLSMTVLPILSNALAMLSFNAVLTTMAEYVPDTTDVVL